MKVHERSKADGSGGSDRPGDYHCGIQEPSPRSLSPREREVMQLLAEGHETAAIAVRLSLAEHTVRDHLRSAHRRLGARSRPHAVALALVRGQIDPIGDRATAARD